MGSGRVLCLLLLCACARANDGDSKVVDTAQGPVKGYREGDLFVYYNIPYATAPTGRDKFKAPLPPPMWVSPFEAVNQGVICPQAQVRLSDDPNMPMPNFNVQDDCLKASVYVPDTDSKNLPVLVIVHGGAYQMGWGDMVTPKHLVQTKKVIAVTFNYRLGALGFLCLGTENAPGNAGMKDQVALLRWVQKNIAKFGGNPNDVTIEGFSAGSSAVDLLVVSKMAKGLFHKAIPESGANVGAWSVQQDPIASAQMYARMLNVPDVDDFKTMEEFYLTAPNELLYKDAFLARPDNDFVFVPCVERNTGVERFLDDSPFNILKKGDYNKVPLLYGFANMEGLFRVNFAYETFVSGMNAKFSNFLPKDLQFKDDTEKEKIADKVKEFYFGDKTKVLGGDTIEEYIDYYTDTMFAYGHLRSVSLQVAAGNDKVYLYEYSFPTDAQMPPGVNVKIRGANHCAQSMSVMDGASVFDRDETKLPDDFKQMKAIMRELWLNFITTGEPVPSGSSSYLPAWPAANVSRSPHMSLTLPPRLEGELLERRARFWDDIYAQYYRAPQPPPNPNTRSDL